MKILAQNTDKAISVSMNCPFCNDNSLKEHELLSHFNDHIKTNNCKIIFMKAFIKKAEALKPVERKDALPLNSKQTRPLKTQRSVSKPEKIQ